MANARRGNPSIHYARTTASLSRFGHDRCEDTSHFGVNRDRLKVTFNTAQRPKPDRPRCTILGK